MKHKDRIDLAIICIIFFAIFGISINAEYKEKKQIEAKEQVIEVQGNATADDVYYLAERDGYVIVYKSDKRSIYEYTNILVEELPDEIAEEIKGWKKMKGIQSIYGFLENYSS